MLKFVNMKEKPSISGNKIKHLFKTLKIDEIP